MSSILYQNENSSTFLLDIPLSIEEAQGWDKVARRQLLSSEPLQFPFKAPEPKSQEKKQAMASDEAYADLHKSYVCSIRMAIKEIHGRHHGDWCTSRKVAAKTIPRKRKAADNGSQAPCTDEQEQINDADCMQGHGDVHLPDSYLKQLSSRTPENVSMTPVRDLEIKYCCVGASLPAEVNDDAEIHHHNSARSGVIFNNPRDEVLRATMCGLHSYSFLIPPESVAVLADCNDPGNLRNALQASFLGHQSSRGTSRKFDLILLDPPWPNRSARRRGSYETQYNLRGTDDLLRGMDLDLHLASGGLVAVWITNKAAIRDLVLGREGSPTLGWFASIGVELMEEWIWIKTTAKGEPNSSLSGVWRKPYEVLLIGKAMSGLSFGVTNKQPKQTKRRIIAAVPDLHSRKPCLKSLFADVLFCGRQFRALEIFSRHMVEGWWSWGNEAVKFNWEGHWCSSS